MKSNFHHFWRAIIQAKKKIFLGDENPTLTLLRMGLFGDANGWGRQKSLESLFESWKTFLINMVKILMMSAKIATLDLLKIKVFWNKNYDVIIYVYDVINKHL